MFFSKNTRVFSKQQILWDKLYVKNCDALKELKIGRYSFSDYSVIEIENVNSLELIEMGEVNRESNSFGYASLELKSE